MKPLDTKTISWIPANLVKVIEVYGEGISHPKHSRIAIAAYARMLSPVHKSHMHNVLQRVRKLASETMLLGYFDHVCELIEELDSYDPAPWSTYNEWLDDVRSTALRLGRLLAKGPKSSDVVLPDWLQYTGALYREAAIELGNAESARSLELAIQRESRAFYNIPLWRTCEAISVGANREMKSGEKSFDWEDEMQKTAPRKLGSDNELFQDHFLASRLTMLNRETFSKPMHEVVAELAQVITGSGDGIWNAERSRWLSGGFTPKVSK